ncbi:MAG: hypothetical protein OXG25_04795 [Gammaproteobacteria bacterium]|nr:hypothetical protein [Gammaproteobacteria bacterium]
MPRFLVLCAKLSLCVCVSSCGNSDAIGDLTAKYPIEIESCVCRFLAFESDSYSGIPYNDMLSQCNKFTRDGHPSLPPDIVSNPTIDSLRCTEAVDDWHETVSEERAQQASNRRNYEELSRTSEQLHHD